MSNVGRVSWDAERALGCGMVVVACSPEGNDRSSDQLDFRRCRSVASTITNRLPHYTSGVSHHER